MLVCFPITLGKNRVHTGSLYWCLTKAIFTVEVSRKICMVEIFQEASNVDSALANSHPSLCPTPSVLLQNLLEDLKNFYRPEVALSYHVWL